MSELPPQVSVLILGGLVHLARPLVCFLVNSDKDPAWSGPRISHIRIADKFLVAPGASTTHVDPETMQALEDPRVEYRQVNLNIAANVEKVYDNPNGGSYDIVFDFTGEGVLPIILPEELLIERTVKLAHALACESRRRNVRAHIRDTNCFMTVSPDAAPAKEGDVPKPKTIRSYWWYEAERAVASVEGLNLAILRPAQVMGPHLYHSAATARFMIGKLYQWTSEPMKWLWGPDLRIHTLWSTDWCRAAWGVAQWVSQRDRRACDDEAGEKLPPVQMKDKVQATLREKVGQGCCPRDATPTAPVFNVVDDEDMTQGKLIKIVGEYYKIEVGFVNAAINAWAKLNFSSVVDEVNERHAAIVEDVFLKYANRGTHLTSFQDPEALANRAIALDGSKIQRVIGWRPTVRIGTEQLQEMMDAWVRSGAIPEALAKATGPNQ
ncbi:uncharacterized protein PFL1_04252 [Pseudozyma flocculosa PF-1]|uniref:NAD-dependent epimerase/dehydratase domain-containing protein n=2 Tax=Pseudozyma flocculosa TaxID=84751 RepID=A0A5C3EVS5_9BASI|nr:uncharacterized protein PFL1_04252 [Pseudozyma flocculosa PF-1]EPQ28426.1 hypothetical protein PFL1_04252 [Pseudozyma flocculosa PF-1]SPO35597.1 uncharacterized protein PSFLO_01068 [Pseudozyma flocculosa]